MKKIIYLLLLVLVSQFALAQTTGIPYQAVIMDKDAGQELPGLDNSYANPLRNSLVSIRFSIHDMNGMEFEEVHYSVIVDDYGMINLIVGNGTYTFNDFFQDMDWNGEEKWLKVELDFENGNDFENLDYLPIHRIPAIDDQKLSLSGDSLILEDGGGVSLTDLLVNPGQDQQQLAPELIFQQKDEIGTLSVNYNGLSAYFIEAIKEQQEQLDKKDKEIKTLKSTLDQLLKRVEKLELK